MMQNKSPWLLQEHLFISLQGGTGQPMFLRVAVRKLYSAVIFLCLAFAITLILSLLFFRELDRNQALEDRMLELETDKKLTQVVPPRNEPAPTQSARSEAVRSEITRNTQSATSTEPADESAKDNAAANHPPILAAASIAAEDVQLKPVTAKIADLSTECIEENCTVKLSLIPNSSGVAQGELLLILETEVPRIGATSNTTEVRKRYYLYPGLTNRDELDPSRVNDLEKKSFRFSHGLQTTANFPIGKLFRPIALNIYLFDANQAVILHERRVIETEETDAP